MTTAIGILARAPVPGSCKTRLMPVLGAEGAARLQRHLIRQTLSMACAARADSVVLFTEGDPGDGLWNDLRRQHPIDVQPQRGADLGMRMADAMRVLLETHRRAVLIGTDCLTLSPLDLRTAAAVLTQTCMVFAPADDGGYVLVGANAFPDCVFRGIAWSESGVMSDTRRRLRDAGWALGREWTELDTHWDIDRPADLRRAMDAGLLDASWESDLRAETADRLRSCAALTLETTTTPEVEA